MQNIPIAQNSAADVAMFASVRSALAFAYSICEMPIAPAPTLGVRGSGGSGTSRLAGLTPHEKHAQGALIRRAVEKRLTGIHLAVTFACFGQGAVRGRAIREVEHGVVPVVRHAGLRRELVKRYFNGSERSRTQAAIAAEFGMSQQSISRLDRAMGTAIEALRIATEAQLEALFVATGIADAVDCSPAPRRAVIEQSDTPSEQLL